MPISRKKACEQCRLAKARCSLDRVCSRCVNRGLACDYNGGVSRAGPYTRPHSFESGRDLSLASPALPMVDPLDLLSPLGSGAPWLEFGAAFRDGSPLLNTEIVDWDLYRVADSRGTLRDQASLNMSEAETHSALPGTSPHHELRNELTSNELPGFILPSNFTEKSQSADIRSTVLPDAATGQGGEAVTMSKNASEFFGLSSPTDKTEVASEKEKVTIVTIHVNQPEKLQAWQQSATPGQSLTARILVGQIENYPRMLIRGSRLPPFIFPQCAFNGKLCRQCTAVNGIHQCLPEPLANCAALTQMFYSRGPGNAQLVWKTMYDEQKRLYEQSHTYDIPTLLAAIQAVTIYMLIQAQDTESVAKNNITCLAVTLAEMTTALNFRYPFHRDIYQDSDLSLKCWAVHESIRRTINLFYVINIALTVQIGSKRSKCGSILATPLPCARDLWDPDATETWALRLHRYKSRISSNRGLVISDLLNALGSDQSGKKSAADVPAQKDLVTWCESLDDFGSLVWMASLLDRQIN
ncbi:hypothetical protein F5B17DRAFT_442556 [Nemania serpens]|nr:hypothetical protein F5B17DRAFT_442556 [Nemania serpens]